MRVVLCLFFAFVCLVIFPTDTTADGPADNIPDKVRRVPKLGVDVPAADHEKLVAGLAALDKKIQALRQKKDSQTRELLPDIIIFYRAVHDALEYQEFFRTNEIKVAYDLLKQGELRADQLAKGDSPWATQTGLVVRGFVSRIDHSVQPYGLVVPETFNARSPHRHRLDIWFHGRGETLSELSFLNQRQRNAGTYQPEDTIVLHPYGRYSNAFKFAGETDVLEALEAVKKHYRIDEDRIAVRGFSMGGAACWQFAVHYADRWFAANPGAGFSETPEFLKFFQKETLNPKPWEKTLWNLYDCNHWAINLQQLPTIAYSGELDIQKQAADIMATALKKYNVPLTHIIGPKTKHSIHPDSHVIIEKKMSALAKRGRQTNPPQVLFSTFTMKYNRMHWVTIDGLKEHWRGSHLVAKMNDQGVQVQLGYVTDFTLSLPAGAARFTPLQPTTVVAIGDEHFRAPPAESDGSWTVSFHQTDKGWKPGKRPAKPNEIRKRHNLQGPIDDAFMDSFIFVRPTGKAQHEAVGQWSNAELERAIVHWRRHFRGNARVKKDTDITADDIANANLVLWGDPQSNQVMKKMADKLPIKWNAKQIIVGDKHYAADKHATIAIYPNPLNPNRYIVLNSSFTYRDFAYLNNARQVPMLPDWAVIDLTTPANYVNPGKVVAADFFDEQWQLKGE